MVKCAAKTSPVLSEDSGAQGLSEGTYTNSWKLSQKTMLMCVSCMALQSKRQVLLKCRDPQDSQEQSQADTEQKLNEKIRIWMNKK